MKKILLVLLTLCATVISQAQLSKKTQLILTHPTAGNIKIIETLQRTGTCDFTDIQFIGAYHTNETYDYSISQALLDTLQTIKIKLVELTDTLSVNDVYSVNACSDDFQTLFDASIGVFFFGGPDIQPELYGEAAHPRTEVTDPFRHLFEASLLFHLLGGIQNEQHRALLESKPDYLVTGFCLGMQTMNVATGGTLIQDIPSEVYHSDETKGLSHLKSDQLHRNFYNHMPINCEHVSGSIFHPIKFKGSFFKPIKQTSQCSHPMVNSYHHQAIDVLGKDLKISAKSMDNKIIEAIHHSDYPHVFAVQFHPERTDFYDPTTPTSFTPDGEVKLLPQWIDAKSMNFHKAYWKFIEGIIDSLQ